MFQKNDTSADRLAIWFSSILRWLLGSAFVITGYFYEEEDGWILIVFGLIMIATGFFRPVRCIGGACKK